MESPEQIATGSPSADEPATTSPVEQPATDPVTTPTTRAPGKEESSSPESSDFSTDTSRSSPEPSPFYLPQAWTYPAWADSPFVSPPRQPMRPSAQPRRLAARAPVPRIQVFGDVALVDGEYEEILLRPSLLVDPEEYDRQARAFLAQQRRIYPEKEFPQVPMHPHARRGRAVPGPSVEEENNKSRDNQGDAPGEVQLPTSTLTAPEPASSHKTILPQASSVDIGGQTLQTPGIVTQSHGVVPAEQRDVELTK